MVDTIRFGREVFIIAGKTKPPYPAEYRARIMQLTRAGRNPEGLAKEFEPSGQTIRNWLRQDDLNHGRRQDGLTSAEREELIKLRRENRRLREEREILAKAAAWFARETNSVPPKSSSS